MFFVLLFFVVGIVSLEFNLVTAELVHDCLVSTPFNATVATQFLSYYRDTLQFQSILAYLKNPPTTYKQPSVDLLGGLDSIQQAVDSGLYKNEYEFEAAVQKLVYATHDAHVTLYAGALSVFTFGAPVSIVSDLLMMICLKPEIRTYHRIGNPRRLQLSVESAPQTS
ncbi:MAG: hypothetical protein Q9207_002743 [Kuettlingeria erythrocarpa]